jgi:phosphoribosylaminoimidazolecarboxamide formyltransferase/IMP cyclohydrolase
MTKIKRALVSVYDKTGIIAFCRNLHKLGVEIIATGGTTRLLKENKIPVKSVSDITHFPEILNGRVKTLHPKILGGILALREKTEHVSELKKHDIIPIDMVVSNLYPFEKVTSKDDIKLREALENIDIGGPNMIRAAAKNFENVVVVVDPKDYDVVLKELKEKGDVSKKTRSRLATEAFRHTSKYDWIIHKFLEKSVSEPTEFPELLNLSYKKIQDLRYGENPHQKAAFYRESDIKEPCVTNAEKLSGKELSWTNVLDLNSALELVKEFDEPAVAIIKHTSPCGVACGKDIFDAFEQAYSSDPLSAFGGIVGANRKIDLTTAKRMSEYHFDAIIAPDFEGDALEVLKKRNVLILMKTGKLNRSQVKHFDIVSVIGGLMVQERDECPLQNAMVVTKIKPTHQQMDSMMFAWKVVKHVKSNAIVLIKGKRTVGIGMGQTSRVDSVKIAINKAGDESKGSIMASDGFFPFRDSIDEATKAGIVAIIQPGGSIKDKEVINVANEHGIAMVFTGMRCFRH